MGTDGVTLGGLHILNGPELPGGTLADVPDGWEPWLFGRFDDGYRRGYFLILIRSRELIFLIGSGLAGHWERVPVVYHGRPCPGIYKVETTYGTLYSPDTADTPATFNGRPVALIGG